MKSLLPDFSRTEDPVDPPKSTLVSIVPFEIREEKPGLIPGTFAIPASVDGSPVCLVIGQSIHYVFIDEDRGNLRVINPSYYVARSVVNDYNSAQMCAGPDACPGLFWFLGEWTPEKIKKEKPNELSEIKRRQYNWFVELVKLADDDWEKTRQHFCISDTQRFALNAIDPTNSKNRPWIIMPQKEQEVDLPTQICPACGSDVPASAVICRYCQYILNQQKYAGMSFATVKTIVDRATKVQ